MSAILVEISLISLAVAVIHGKPRLRALWFGAPTIAFLLTVVVAMSFVK